MSAHAGMPKSAWVFPALSVALFATITATHYDFTPSMGGIVFAVVLLAILFGTVFAAVHHAEVIAHRIGEPFGTLLLTLAVTIIEVALIATIMLGEKEVPTLARDTVFAVVMIVCNGLVGVCVFIGGLSYREQDFQVPGANLYLVTTPTGQAVAGNVGSLAPGVMASQGWQETEYRRLDDQDNADHRALVRVTELTSGFRLLIGRDLEERRRLFGIVAQAAGFVLLDALTPGKLGEIVTRERFHPATLVSVSIQLALGIIIAAAIS